MLLALCVQLWDSYCSISTKLTTALFRFLTTRYFNAHVRWYRYAFSYDKERPQRPFTTPRAVLMFPHTAAGILGFDRARR